MNTAIYACFSLLWIVVPKKTSLKKSIAEWNCPPLEWVSKQSCPICNNLQIKWILWWEPLLYPDWDRYGQFYRTPVVKVSIAKASTQPPFSMFQAVEFSCQGWVPILSHRPRLYTYHGAGRVGSLGELGWLSLMCIKGGVNQKNYF